MTKEEAIKLMTHRGYESVSHNESANEITIVNFIKRFDDICIHSQVKLKSETFTLEFLDLKYLCKISVGNVAIDHKDFEKYEQIMLVYVAKCLDVDVFQVLEVAKLKTPGVDKVALSIKERKREFWEKIRTAGKEKGLSQRTCLDFYNHWTEMNEGGRKMRFEMQKVFDIKKRLTTWIENEKKFTPTWKLKEEKKIEKQEKEVTEWKPVVQHKDLF